MDPKFNFDDVASLLAKQTELIHICYDRLLEVMRETTNESVLIKCVEILRKDLTALLAPSGNKNDALSDTLSRIAEIEKQLKKL